MKKTAEAKREGFEPSMPRSMPVFKTGAINLSAISSRKAIYLPKKIIHEKDTKQIETEKNNKPGKQKSMYKMVLYKRIQFVRVSVYVNDYKGKR